MGHGECSMPTAPGLPLPVTLTGLCDGVDLASEVSIGKTQFKYLSTIDDAVGLFQNITIENDSTMSCKKT